MYEKLIESFMFRNSNINLSAIRSADDIKIKHIDDSLILKEFSVFEFLNLPENFELVDVGTGSGFPLFPLAMEYKNIKCVGLESINKKVKALNEIIKELKLKNVEVIWTRSEDYNKKQFDVLTARAVAYIDKLLKITYHLVKKNGYFIFYKLDSKKEYEDILQNIKKYNLQIVKKENYKLFYEDVDRILYILKKK